MRTPFVAHGGLLRARRDGQVLRVEGSGATNLEGAQKYIETLTPLIGELQGSRWGVLGMTDSEALLTPEAEQLMTAAAARLSIAGRVAVAIVFPPTSPDSIMRAQWSRVYADAGCKLAFFTDESLARLWLEKAIAAD